MAGPLNIINVNNIYTKGTSSYSDYPKNQISKPSKGDLSASQQPNDTKDSKQDQGISLTKRLDPQEEKKIQELKSIDLHVRAHEHAHIMAGGPYVRGGPQYTYIIGPDGKQYAVAGEVEIDVSPVPGNPEATIRKAQVVKRAALAPSDPSPQDRAVAALADQMAMKARMEEARENLKKLNELLQKNQEGQFSINTNTNSSVNDNTTTSFIQGGNIMLKKQAVNAYSLPMNPKAPSINLIA